MLHYIENLRISENSSKLHYIENLRTSENSSMLHYIENLRTSLVEIHPCYIILRI